MREKKERQEKHKIPFSLRKQFAEILVASHREEPYIITFRYTADNVAAQGLGTLLGFFEIEAKDRDAAYIVNFLASVLKKEYFANPRRGATESFEAALHKINVALSELVKHGNVSWLGHLNGALSIVVGDTLHFSVTGEGTVYLFRNQTLRSISEGLAVREENPHPLKTFVEISSGQLLDQDRIFLFSPSIWTLFSPIDIEKNVLRFSFATLEQFLRTALINELESGATLIIACEKENSPTLEPKKTASALSSSVLSNVFAETAFRKKEPAPSSNENVHPSSDGTPTEFVDAKTGHIYVHGVDIETKKQLPGKEYVSLLWHHLVFRSYQLFQKTKKSQRKIKKLFILALNNLEEYRIRYTRLIERKGYSMLERIRQRIFSPHSSHIITSHQENINQQQPNKFLGSNNATPKPVFHKQSLSQLGAWLVQRKELISSSTKKSRSNIHFQPHFFQNTLGKYMGCVLNSVEKAITLSLKGFQSFATIIFNYWKNLSSPFQGVFLVILSIISISFVYWIGFSRPADEIAPIIDIAPPSSVPPDFPFFSLEEEKGATLLSPPETLITLTDETIVATIYLKETPYLITDKHIFNLFTTESISTPNRVRRVIGMNDINTLFLVTEKGSLLSYTPTNKRFAENTLPLPAGGTINALGAYLTYLYVFDIETRRLYRFPRVEGGFGNPISWFREDITLLPPVSFAVKSIVALANNDQVTSYERGKVKVKNFESPVHRGTITALIIAGEKNTVYALDRNNGRILVWSEDGVLKKQYFSRELTESIVFDISPDEKTLLVGNDKTIIRFQLP